MKVITLIFLSVTDQGLLYEIEYKKRFGKELTKKVFIPKIGDHFSAIAVWHDNGSTYGMDSLYMSNIVLHDYLSKHKKD